MEKKTNQYNWGAGIPIGIGIAFAVGLALNNFILGIPVGFVMALAIASAYVKPKQTPPETQDDPAPEPPSMDK